MTHVESVLRKSKTKRWLREFAAILFWMSILLVLVWPTSIAHLAELLRLPDLSKVGVPLLIFICLAIIWYALGSFKNAKCIGFILVYPVVLATRIIPKILMKYAPLAIAFSPAIYSAATLIRMNIAIFAIAILAATFVFAFNQPVMIIIGTLLIAICLMVHFGVQLRNAFKAQTVFAMAAKWIGNTWDALKESDALKIPEKSLGAKSPDYDTKIFSLYVFSAVLEHLQRTVRIVAESRKLDIYLIASWLITVAFTTVSFAFIYYGIERAYPGSFSGDKDLFAFLKYSICVLTTSDLTRIEPVSNLASNISAFELIGSLGILVLLVFLILTSLRDRYKDDLRKVREELDATLSQVREVSSSRSSLSEQAIEAFLVMNNRALAEFAMRFKYPKETVAKLIAELQEKQTENQDVSEDGKNEKALPRNSNASIGGNSKDRRKKRRQLQREKDGK